MASLATYTAIPRLQKPAALGGVIWINGNIHGDLAGFDQQGNLRMPAGDQIHPARFNGFIGRPAGKKGFQAKILGLNGMQRYRIPETDPL